MAQLTIELATGDLLDADVEALVNTVNTGAIETALGDLPVRALIYAPEKTLSGCA